MTYHNIFIHISITLLTAFFYRFLFSKTNNFVLNRVFILFGLVCSLIPFFPSTSSIGIPSVELPAFIVGSESQNLPSFINSYDYWGITYYLGLGVAAIILLVKLVGVILLFLQSQATDQAFLRTTSASHCARSFLFWRFSPSETWPAYRPQILAHELGHVTHLHSLDVLFLEGLKIIFWFNPLLYKLHRDLITLHEYQADRFAQKHAGLTSETLLKAAVSSKDYSLASSFSSSFYQIKNRIYMLQKKNNSSLKNAIYLCAFTALSSSFLLLSCAEPASTPPPPPPPPSEQEGTQKVLIRSKINDGKEMTKEEQIKLEKSIPKYEGGQAAMIEFLQENTVYPEAEKKAGIEERVILQFYVESTGVLTNITVLSGKNENLIQASKDVLLKMPKWIPGEVDGKPVSTKFKLPFLYKLK